MLKIGLSGCNGKMGRVITSIVDNINDVQIVFGVSKTVDKYENSYKVYSDTDEIKEICDVVIDFSSVDNLENILKYCLRNNTPIVIATTGFNREEENYIKTTSQKIAILKTTNTSVGVNLILELAKLATNALYGDFDIEIVEKHHNQKVDAPSGTAKTIASTINKELENNMKYNYGRNEIGKRDKNEIGMHAIRGGSIVGEHTIIFAGEDEIIEIKHEALSKAIFAKGAIKASRYMKDKTSGMYNMQDLINNI